jgi:hypothetical protein
MVQGLLGGDMGHFGGGEVTEGSTGGGEDQAGDFVAASRAEALVGAVVFAVDGEEFGSGGAGGGHDEFAAGHQDLFIGESDGLAEADGFVGGGESGDADDGGEDEAYGRILDRGEASFLAMEEFWPLGAIQILGFQITDQGGAGGVIRHNGDGGLELGDLGGEESCVGSGR